MNTLCKLLASRGLVRVDSCISTSLAELCLDVDLVDAGGVRLEIEWN